MIYNSILLTSRIISVTLTPIFLPRYMFAAPGLFLIPMTLGISLIPLKSLRFTALALFIIANLFTIKDIYTKQFNGPMKEIVHDLKDSIKPGDLIITSEGLSMGPFLYYFPRANHFFYILEREAKWQHIFNVFKSRVTIDTDPEKILSGYNSFWLVNRKGGRVFINGAEITNDKHWEEVSPVKDYSLPYSWFGVMISKFEYTGDK